MTPPVIYNIRAQSRGDVRHGAALASDLDVSSRAAIATKIRENGVNTSNLDAHTDLNADLIHDVVWSRRTGVFA